MADVNNHIAEHHLQTKHEIDWDSATCITYSTDYYQRLSTIFFSLVLLLDYNNLLPDYNNHIIIYYYYNPRININPSCPVFTRIFRKLFFIEA